MNKSATVAAVSFIAVALTLSACGSDEGSNGQAEATAPGQTATSPTASPTDAPDSNGDELSAQIINTDGAPVAEATLDFSDGFATVTVETTGNAYFAPGFHSMHLHQIGQCEPNSVEPDGGAPGDFKSAGEHFQAPGHTGHPASGDLPDLLVRSNGAAKQMITTDAFTATNLLDDDKAAIIIHERADIDGDKRIACGVVEAEES